MLLIPTITLTQLKPTAGQGALSDKTHSTAEPMPMAANWVRAGARRLHLNDRNGAAGKTTAADVIRALVQAHPGIPLQVCGAMRDEQAVENYLAAGAEYVVLSTKAASAPHFVNDLCLEYPGHILVALESRQGKVAAEGWSKLAQHSVLEVAQHFEREGVAAILYRAADTGRGHYDFEAAQSLAQALTIPVLVSGGLVSAEAVARLCRTGASLAGAVLDAEFAAGASDFAKMVKLAARLSAAE
jgi:phosphoribosylformimino-5-aminoimidazole carboxamide ribotide isomerase